MTKDFRNSIVDDARPETRLPAAYLDRARQWYRDKLGLNPTEVASMEAITAHVHTR